MTRNDRSGTRLPLSEKLTPDQRRRYERLERLSSLLDESIRIPVIGYRIGYDALIGLVPGIGDAAGLLVGIYIVAEAARFRLPASTVLRMVANVALEAVVGTIPLLGDAFDAVYKANLRNVRLLRARLHDHDPPGTDRYFFIALICIPLFSAVLLAAGLVALTVWIL